MEEQIVFSGKIGEVVHISQQDGRLFEQYRRSPGIRLVIISNDGKILITREKRFESESVDLRLPGGKVCDTLEAYRVLRQNKDGVIQAAKRAAIKEALEETGLEIKEPTFLVKANAGSTVEWDLYYFVVKSYSKHSDGQQLEQGEDIKVTWMTPEEVVSAIGAGKMQEWRSVGVLLGLVLPTL